MFMIVIWIRSDPNGDVMGTDTAFSYFQELEILKELDEEQSKAFLDLLVLAKFADTKVTEDELEQMDEELMRLPFLWDADVRERVVAHSAETRTYLEEHITDHETVTKFVKELGARITEEAHQTVALRMFVAVTIADGITELERNRCITFAEALGQRREDVDRLIEQLADH